MGLEIGADDYVSKPFNPREVVARVRAVLRRAQGEPPPPRVIHLGSLVLEPDAHRLEANGQPLHLTPTEFGLLLALAELPGHTLARTGADRAGPGLQLRRLGANGGQPYQESTPKTRRRGSHRPDRNGVWRRLPARSGPVNRLWVRLTLAFALVILVTVVAIGLLADLTAGKACRAQCRQRPSPRPRQRRAAYSPGRCAWPRDGQKWRS